MSKVSDEQAEAAYNAFVGECEWEDWDKPELMRYIRAALEAVSSIHEAEPVPVAWRADHEVDGEYTRKYTSSEWEAYQWNEAGLNVEGLALIDPFASDRKADLADMGAYIRQRDDAVADLELAEARLRNLQQKAQEQGVADGNMLNRIHPLHGDTRERPTPISKGVTVKSEWPRYEVRSEGPGEEAGLSGMEAWVEIWSVLRFDNQRQVDEQDGSWVGFFIDRAEASRTRSCLSHTAGEIEAGGEAEPE